MSAVHVLVVALRARVDTRQPVVRVYEREVHAGAVKAGVLRLPVASTRGVSVCWSISAASSLLAVSDVAQPRRASPVRPSEGKIASCDSLSLVAAGSWGER